MLHIVSNSKNLKSISLKLFEPYHGQNEADSAHSAINSAIITAGNVTVPSELKSIISLPEEITPTMSTV